MPIPIKKVVAILHKCDDCTNATSIFYKKEKSLVTGNFEEIKYVDCKLKGTIKLNFPGKMGSCKDNHPYYTFELNMENWQWIEKEVQ